MGSRQGRQITADSIFRKTLRLQIIHEDFAFNKDNPVLKVLDFGAGIKRREKAIKEMEKLAAREGLRIISEEEYQEFLMWKEQTVAQQK